MKPARSTVLRVALFLTPLLAFALYAAVNWFRIEDTEKWVQMGADAIRDPYLAYTRLLAKMNAGARFSDQPTRLDALPPGGVLLLASRRLVYMTPPRVARLAAWVDGGGTLVVEAESAGIDDPLLEAFGVSKDVPDPKVKGKAKARPVRKSTVVMFDWNGSGSPLRVDFGFLAVRLREERPHADVVAGSMDGEKVALAFPSGQGRVVALGSFSFLRNTSIGQLDHAELGWQLASRGRDRGGALLFLRPPRAALGEWLMNEAWPVLIAAGLLLALWLLRVVARFGPMAPQPLPTRRRLGEHIAASGRFLWSRGESAYLLQAARDRVWRMAARRFARFAKLEPAAAVERVAESAATSRVKVHRALVAPAETEGAFVAATSALQDLEARLGYARGANPSNRERA